MLYKIGGLYDRARGSGAKKCFFRHIYGLGIVVSKFSRIIIAGDLQSKRSSS